MMRAVVFTALLVGSSVSQAILHPQVVHHLERIDSVTSLHNETHYFEPAGVIDGGSITVRTSGGSGDVRVTIGYFEDQEFVPVISSSAFGTTHTQEWWPTDASLRYVVSLVSDRNSFAFDAVSVQFLILGLIEKYATHREGKEWTSATPLYSGVERTGISATEREDLHFFIDDNVGGRRLVVETYGGSGDADIWFRESHPLPTPRDTIVRSNFPGNEDRVEFYPTKPTRYFVKLYSWEGWNDVTLKATFVDIPSKAIEDIPMGVAQRVDGSRYEPKYYRVDLSSSYAAEVTVAFFGGLGDASLYASTKSQPTHQPWGESEQQSEEEFNSEFITFNAEQLYGAQNLYVTVWSHLGDFSNARLLVQGACH